MATLLHLYCPGNREPDQVRTKELLATEPWPDDLRVVGCPGVDDNDNARAILEYWWDVGDLLTVEQDIEVTAWHVAELRACPEPVCGWDALMAHGVSWSLVPMGGTLGLWKATYPARMAVSAFPPVPQVPWNDLGGAICQRMGMPHVHGPLIGHNHKLG